MLKRLAFLLLGYAGTAFLVLQLFTAQQPTTDQFALVRTALFVLMLAGILRVALIFLVAPWNDVVQRVADARRRRAKRRSPHRPLVSVLVPAWNEEVGIRPTVQSLLTSTYTPLEVVVVNDGSTDGTHDVIQAMLSERAGVDDGKTLTYRRQENAGKSRAMNRGLAAARGEIIMTVDADSVVAPDAVERIVDRFADPEVQCVAGNVKIGNHRSVIGLVQKLEYLMGFFSKNADSLLSAVYIVGGAAAAYRRSLFDKLGGFAENIITEDIEMSTRAQDAGMRVEYAPRAIVYTEGPSRIPGLAKQRLRWKHGRLITFWRYRHLFLSLRKGHHPWLTWLVLPLALLGDLVLLVQWAIFTFVVWFAISHGDFVPAAVYVSLLATLVTVQVLLDVRRRESLHLLWMAPAAWLSVLTVDLIEFQALVRSLFRLARGKELRWQRWKREGVFDGPKPTAEVELPPTAPLTRAITPAPGATATPA